MAVQNQYKQIQTNCRKFMAYIESMGEEKMRSFTKVKNAEEVWVGGKEVGEILESTKDKDKPAVE